MTRQRASERRCRPGGNNLALRAGAGMAVAAALTAGLATAEASEVVGSASPREGLVLGAGPPGIDRRSFNLGIIAGFAEIVGAGVKTLALSEVLDPQEAEALEAEAERIAQRNGVLLYRETDLLVTDLFPADVAAGKHVLLIYKGTTLDEYRRLKDEKARLEREGRYDGAARRSLAERFGRLLSYPQTTIDTLLAQRAR